MGGRVRGLAFAIALAASGAGLLPQQAAFAQTWPSRPIRIVVPLPPGGAVDTVARVAAAGLSERLAVPVVIENRGGATGTLGVTEAVRAPADGHTLLFASADTLVILPQVRKNVPFDVERQLTPVAKVADVYLLFAATPGFAARSMKELIEQAKAKPGAIGVATAGNGTLHHLTLEYVNQLAGVKLAHVPFNGGAPASAAVIGGHVEVLISGLNVFKAVQSGQIRGIAVAKQTRSALLPDLPTLGESGYGGIVSSSWFGVLGPAGLPPAVTSRLSEALVAIASSAKFGEQLLALGAEAGAMGQAEFAGFIAAESRRWRAVIDAAGLRLEE